MNKPRFLRDVTLLTLGLVEADPLKSDMDIYYFLQEYPFLVGLITECVFLYNKINVRTIPLFNGSFTFSFGGAGSLGGRDPYVLK